MISISIKNFSCDIVIKANPSKEAEKENDDIFTINGEGSSEGAKAFMMDVLKEVQIEMSVDGNLMGITTPDEPA